MNDFISLHDTRYDEVARALVVIGHEAIAVEDDAALDRYFAADFTFHGPDGHQDLAGVKVYFAVVRAAFDGFACERREIIRQGDLVGARTTMSDIFVQPFTLSPLGRLEPTGHPMTHELTNVFRHDGQGRPAEEWVQATSGFCVSWGSTCSTDDDRAGQAGGAISRATRSMMTAAAPRVPSRQWVTARL